MVVGNGQVDIQALKARHPLGEVVEASQRLYCFGCGMGGDVLDFIRDVEALSLPEAIQRLDGGSGPMPRAIAAPRAQVAPRRPSAAVVPQRDQRC